MRSPGIAPDGFGPWGVYHGTNYGGQGSLAPGGYVAVRESGFDQQPPLLSSLEGGGQDPELLGQASAHLCGGFPNRRGGCPLGMRQGDEFLRHPLASFLQMASYGGQTVVVDSVLATTCAAAQ